MIVKVRWASTYEYSEPIRQLHSELRVLPRADGRQRVQEGSIDLAPDGNVTTLADVFGNRYEHVDYLGALDSLELRVHANVAVDGARKAREPLSPLLRSLYTQETERCPFEETIAELASGLGAEEPLAAARALSDRIGESLRYELGATDASSGALDALERGAGVCQDFAHLMLAGLRSIGIPARYVSGYLAPRSGEAIAEATHAWVQVYADDAWHGLDPSHGMPEDERHVVVAVGRDYGDVMPLRGVFVGCATERWTTTVEFEASQAQQ